MNYGKRSTSKKRNALISRTSMLEKRAHVSFIRVLFTALIAVCVMVVCLGIGSFRGVIAGAPDVNDVDISPLGYATFLYDDQGTQIRQLSAPTSNRLPVSLDQIPVSLQHAVVAIEDERFYEHNGIDVRGIARAGMKAITTGNFSEGASTITQQLLKNNVFTDWTNESTQLERFTRKFQEQYLAVQIEKKYDKNVILENYLNTINLGAGSYGVQAASKKYFNKDVWDLNLSECATLAGITQNPTKFNPITNPKANSKRRKEVLDHMLDQNYISQDEYNAALNDDVYSRIQAAQLENTEEESTVYTYFEDEVTNQVISDLMNIKGYTKTQATNLLYSGGLKIMTTLDSNMQQILDEEYANPDNYPANVQYELDYALTVQSPDGKQTNYSKEMLQLYFRDQDPEFDLLFDSPEEGQQYVDQYKANILADGSTVVSERVNFAPQPQSSMTPFAIQEDQSQNPPVDVLTFRGWRVDVPDNDDVYLDLNGKEVLENGVPLTNSDVHDKLTDMAGETLYVDVGLGFQLDRNGAVIPSTAFDSALSGMDILGFGLDEDGDPKNIVSIMLRISDVFGGYQHNDAANTEGTWGPAGNYDDASRLVSKFEKAHNGLIQEHVELSSQADYLETNQTRLKSTFDSLNNELVAIEDIDRVDAILQLSYAQTCYNAALQVGANVIPQSLMDYLR